MNYKSPEKSEQISEVFSIVEILQEEKKRSDSICVFFGLLFYFFNRLFVQSIEKTTSLYYNKIVYICRSAS